MKKEIKKKVTNSILATSISALAITPIAVVMSQNSSLNNLIGEVVTYGTNNSGYALFSTGRAPISSRNSEGVSTSYGDRKSVV